MNIFWSKYTQLESSTSSADPLALDYMAQQLGYLILPNFTTRTSRARYYSMVCFGLKVCEKAAKKLNKVLDDSLIKDCFEIYEKFWAISVADYYVGDLNKKESEMRGKQGAVKAYNNNIKNIDNSFKLLSRQLELGALGAYRSSLEKYGLIKEGSLALTIKGKELADKFIHRSGGILTQYEELVISSILDKKTKDKYGNATFNKFGSHSRLDFLEESDEINILRKVLLDSDNITNTTAKYCLSKQDEFENNYLGLIESINNEVPSDELSKEVIYRFKTIYAYEKLSIALSNLFFEIILTTFNNGGNIEIEELTEYVKEYLDEFRKNKYGINLINSPRYSSFSGYFYSVEFGNLIQSINQGSNNKEFIRGLLTYHKGVMNKRKSYPWIEVDGNMVRANFGYDYAKNTGTRIHTYKINNLFSIIADTEWGK